VTVTHISEYVRFTQRDKIMERNVTLSLFTFDNNTPS